MNIKENKKTITIRDFDRVEIRVGTIIYIQDFSKPYSSAYKLWVDFGHEIGIKNTIAKVKSLYQKEALLRKQVIGLINIEPNEIAHLNSEFLLTGLGNENGEIVLVSPEQKVPNGSRLF